MNKNEITTIVKDEIDKYMSNNLDNEVKNNLSKANSQSRKEMIKAIKDSLESVYKLLWQKKEFWKSDIK